MHPPLIVGNWKMNGDHRAAYALATAIVNRTQSISLKAKIVLCPAFIHLPLVQQTILTTDIALGGQDCHFAAQGAYTGDISAAMLVDMGCQYVLVGHSERRQQHGETDVIVSQKTKAAHKAGLKAIVCIGETQQEREEGKTLTILKNQLYASLPHDARADNTIIAYEPIWSIGTGITASLQEFAPVYQTLRKLVLERFDQEGQQMSLLYGGSVKSTNINIFKDLKGIGGVLVGGASLDAEDFFKIALSYN